MRLFTLHVILQGCIALNFESHMLLLFSNLNFNLSMGVYCQHLLNFPNQKPVLIFYSINNAWLLIL